MAGKQIQCGGCRHLFATVATKPPLPDAPAGNLPSWKAAAVSTAIASLGVALLAYKIAIIGGQLNLRVMGPSLAAFATATTIWAADVRRKARELNPEAYAVDEADND
jgi:hypothetical protein